MALTWSQFIAIPNGTQILNHGFDQCVALANLYNEDVIGGRFVGVSSAHQWWTNFHGYPQLAEKYYQSVDSVPGAIFVARGGIYNATHGHIGVVTADGPTTIDTMEQNAGTWRYVGRYTRGMANIYGFLIPHNNPAQQVITSNQRQVGANPANRRTGPSTTSLLKEPVLAPGTIGNFDGWIYGEQVTDGTGMSTNIWYRGISGDWFWAGAFTSQSTVGLSDLNPANPTPVGAQRKVGVESTNIRQSPTTNSAIVGTLSPNAIVTPLGWATGQKVGDFDLWYKMENGYSWAGAFTTQSKDSLLDVTPVNPGPTDPAEPTDPTAPVDDLGSPGSVLATIDRWNESAPNFGTVFNRPNPATVDLVLPSPLFERVQTPVGGFYEGREAAPNHIVIHHAVHTNLNVVTQTLNGPNAPTSNYAVKDAEIVSMVDERDTPSTNGRWRSNQYSVTMELCNEGTNTGKPSAATHESAAWLAARAALRWGMKVPLAVNETVFGHKTVSKTPTACPGDTDLEWITNRANEIIRAQQESETPAPPDYSDLEEKISGLTKVLESLITLLKKIFRVE